MHTSIIRFTLSALFSAVVMAGCATKTPYLDERFGDAVNAAKAQQIVNPEASLDTDPVAGVDGQAANATVDRYHKSFEQPPASTNVFNIGVGSGGSSSSTNTSGTK